MPEIFISAAHGLKNQRRKPASEKWSRFMAPVSEVCVMGLVRKQKRTFLHHINIKTHLMREF